MTFNNFSTPAWVEHSGAAQDIAVSVSGQGFIVGTQLRPGGATVLQQVEGTGWREVGAGLRVAVAPDGTPWVVDEKMRILRLGSSGWIQVPGEGRDIGVGGDGSVWVVGSDPAHGGFGLHRLDEQGQRWSSVAGGAEKIAVDPRGFPWVVNNLGEVYSYDGNSWLLRATGVLDLGIGGSGSVALACADGIVRVLQSGANGAWINLVHPLCAVAVLPGDTLIGVDAEHRIFSCDGAQVHSSVATESGKAAVDPPELPSMFDEPLGDAALDDVLAGEFGL